MVRKILPILSALVVSTGLSVGVAAADTSCSIGITGPHSQNDCTSKTTNTLNENCNNNVDVNNHNQQSATSGSANVNDNTLAGNASSGNASNSNHTNTQVSLSCGSELASVSSPGVTPSAPGAGGRGAGAAAPVVAALSPGMGAGAAQAVSALPETGSNAARNVTIAGATVLGGFLAASQLGVSSYRRKMLE